ncbi:MAG TPA: histidinol-phosphatase [Alphaproteobacteria bacterium]|nr:histidinol-phosphatase [Alphaproteobacteria bacterium]
MAEPLDITTLNRFMDLADDLVDAAGEVLNHYFRTPMRVDSKDDESPVTKADRDAEIAMRALIEDAHPDHGIIGEELEPVNPDADFVWVLDPIDGTKSFITGKPLFGTLVALAQGGRPILGIINQPVLHERWRGAAGKATTFNEEVARVRPCPDLASAVLYATSPHMFHGADAEAFARVSDAVQHALYGGDCYAYGLLASGHADLVVEADLKPFDYAALVPVVEGAGGIITDWAGEPLTLASDGRVIAAGDAGVHAAALERLQGA